MPINYLHTGTANVPDGTEVMQRGSREGAEVTARLHGTHFEAARRGDVFVACQTAAVTGIVITGTTSSWSLYNPSGSGYYLSLIRADMITTTIAGTPLIGGYMLTVNTNPSAAATTGTAVIPTSGIIGGGRAAVGKPLTSATLPVAPTFYRPLAAKMTGAATTIPNQQIYSIDCDGTALLSPGCTISMHVLLNDTTNAAILGTWIWEEVVI